MDLALARQVFSCIDNTTLTGTDNVQSVEAFCRRTLEMRLEHAGQVTTVAAVCVYPRFVSVAAKMLKGSGIKVASVAGAFPHGQLPLPLKVEEVRQAVGDGADEVDIVLNRGLLLAGEDNEVRDEVARMKEACEGKVLKVILEVCELPTPALIRRAAELAMEGGADFIKTSTGKGSGGATPEAAAIMLEAIENYVKIYKKTVGFKAAGGIRKPEEALVYAELCKKIMGDKYVNNETFRIGASRLTEELFSILTF